jgi:hypothetical protein
LRERSFPRVSADDVVFDHEAGGVDFPVVDPLVALNQVGLVKLGRGAFWQRWVAEIAENKRLILSCESIYCPSFATNVQPLFISYF